MNKVKDMIIIAGNCLMTDDEDKKISVRTASLLKDRNLASAYRCKIWGGGTTPEKYQPGIRNNGIPYLKQINELLLPAGTEVQSYSHINVARNLSFIWVGARNCQNYELLNGLRIYQGEILIKRGFGITIKETIGIYDIMKKIIGKDVYIIERGVNVFDRQDDSRWSPDLKGIIQLKFSRPDIFERLFVDCSHSVGRKEYILDTYKAFKAIGVKNFMFECSVEPEKSKTDRNQILNIDELEVILNA
jgi:3-deoxy-7-phosphoheptulonate synthase